MKRTLTSLASMATTQPQRMHTHSTEGFPVTNRMGVPGVVAQRGPMPHPNPEPEPKPTARTK